MLFFPRDQEKVLKSFVQGIKIPEESKKDNSIKARALDIFHTLSQSFQIKTKKKNNKNIGPKKLHIAGTIGPDGVYKAYTDGLDIDEKKEDLATREKIDLSKSDRILAKLGYDATKEDNNNIQAPGVAITKSNTLAADYHRKLKAFESMYLRLQHYKLDPEELLALYFAEGDSSTTLLLPEWNSIKSLSIAHEELEKNFITAAIRLYYLRKENAREALYQQEESPEEVDKIELRIKNNIKNPFKNFFVGSAIVVESIITKARHNGQDQKSVETRNEVIIEPTTTILDSATTAYINKDKQTHIKKIRIAKQGKKQ